MCNPDKKTLKTKLSLFRIGFLKTHTNNPHNELKINFLSYKKIEKVDLKPNVVLILTEV